MLRRFAHLIPDQRLYNRFDEQLRTFLRCKFHGADTYFHILDAYTQAAYNAPTQKIISNPNINNLAYPLKRAYTIECEL